jgi:hypothetical protein
MLPVWTNSLQPQKGHGIRKQLRNQWIVAASIITFLLFIFWSTSDYSTPSDLELNWNSGNLDVKQIDNKHADVGQTEVGKVEPVKPRKRLLLKVGGVPSEGFGSSLGFIRHAIRLANVLEVDFAPVRTLDWEGLYSVMDELNRGIDFADYNWNNMCNLHTTIMTRKEVWGSFTARIDVLRQGLERLLLEVDAYSQDLPYDKALIETAKKRLESCDVIIFADQMVHSDGFWDRVSRKWIHDAIGRNVQFKLDEKKVTPITPKDIHVHFRWSDIKEKIGTSDKKWAFNNTALEISLKSIETCLGRELSSNIFMKRSKAQETEAQLREIVQPIRPTGTFIEGEDDIADLWHLSKAKILAITGGTYSNTAAAIGDPAMIVHNGIHVGTYQYLKRAGVVILQEGELMNADQCSTLTAALQKV